MSTQPSVSGALLIETEKETERARSTVTKPALTPTPVTIADAFSKVRFFNGRTLETSDEAMQGASALLSEYRDGGVYVTHYSGFSE
ncbi:hypothetical protein [uncultured Shewanella sp.]|uniref:hypothetical protein n=1 Tax=uncultured Shewanella sp. TaxID=173975 RepID=UPI0026239480|nr:hypothetical protein [uncultured Shewanella sp.]